LTAETQRLRRLDLHLHTQFSDGNSTVDAVSRAALAKGLTHIAVTDHYSELTPLPNRLSQRDLGPYLTALERVPAFKGLEVEILAGGAVSISPETRQAFDVIVGGLHTLHGIQFWRDWTPILDAPGFLEDVRVALITALESRCLDVLAHATWLPPALQAQRRDVVDEAWMVSVIEAASAYGVAIELNGRWRLPDAAWVQQCVRHGVPLSLGSDAHTLREVGNTGHGVQLLTDLHVPPDLVYLPQPMMS